MSLSEKLKQARLEAGLSQRQLCADKLTRNMLSQIENGSARPSMTTLQYLAGRLGKPVSYFLEETAVTSPNQQTMAAAREAWEQGDAAATVQALTGYQAPDPVFDREQGLLSYLCALELAETALAEDRIPYARQLLAEAEQADSPYITEEHRLRYWQLLAQADPAQLKAAAAALALDDALLVKAWAAIAEDPDRSVCLLSACEDQASSRWNLAMGCARMAQREYTLAALHLRRAEADYPAEAVPRLEVCYRELGDFEKAYTYACKQR